MAWPSSKTTKRKPAKRKAVRPVRSASQKKAPIVRTKRSGKGFVVTVGGQSVGRPTTKAVADRRATQLRAKAKKNPASTAQMVTRCKQLIAQDERRRGKEAKPTITDYRDNPDAIVRIPISAILRTNGDQSIEATIAEMKKKAGGKIPRFRPFKPIIVVRSGRSGKFIITDGFHRTALSIMHNKRTIAARIRNANPAAEKKSRLHVVSITPGNFGVFLGKYCLKKRIKTKAAAESYIESIHRRRRNPSAPKIGARIGRELLKAFDVDSDGDLDKRDVKILEHFNQPTIVIDDKTKQLGEVIAQHAKPVPAVTVQWADGTKSTVAKKDLRKVNGFRSWRLQRKAVRAYKKSLKATASAQRAKAAQKAAEREIRARRPAAGKRKNPLSGDKKAQAAFRTAVKRLANKTATVKDLQHAMRAGEKAGLTQTEVWRVVKKHWNDAARKHGKKRNPGIVSVLAEIMMGTAAALDVKKQLLDQKPASRSRRPKRKVTAAAKPRAKKRIVAVRKPGPKKNPDGYAGFQGRESMREVALDGPVNLPKRTWVLGRLWELGVRGRTLLNFRRRDGKPIRRYWLLSDYANKYLWIAGPPMAHPDPTIKEGEVRPFGTLTTIAYETRKDHLGDEADTPYEHEFGEEGGRRPVLGIDRDGYAHIIGGDFIITDLGIKD